MVYLIRCKICNDRYVGETNKKFRLRWNNYRQNQRFSASGLDHKQPFFHPRWLDENHNGLEADAEVTPLSTGQSLVTLKKGKGSRLNLGLL